MIANATNKHLSCNTDADTNYRKKTRPGGR